MSTVVLERVDGNVVVAAAASVGLTVWLCVAGTAPVQAPVTPDVAWTTGSAAATHTRLIESTSIDTSTAYYWARVTTAQYGVPVVVLAVDAREVGAAMAPAVALRITRAVFWGARLAAVSSIAVSFGAFLLDQWAFMAFFAVVGVALGLLQLLPARAMAAAGLAVR